MNDSRKKMNNVYLAVIIIAVIAMLVMIIGYVGHLKDEKETAVLTETEEDTSLKEAYKEDKILVSVSTETIADGLNNMGFLVTQEYYFTQVETYTKEKDILFNVLKSSSELVYSYDGSVFAGIDFEKITLSKDDSNKKIIVDLPDAEIQTVTVDKDTFKVYSEKDYIWNPLDISDYNLSLSEFEDAAREKAIDSGILDRAEEQAEIIISNFISNFPSANGYKVEFK